MTCENSIRLELSYLLKNGYFKKGVILSSKISWTGGANIGIRCCLDGKWIKLIFSVTNKSTGEKTDYNYKIHLVGVPSNLGQGEVLYFVCPSTGRRCRVLYMANGEDCFYSRYHYENKGKRLLYDSQCSSKKYYSNDRYHAIDKQLEKYYSNRKKDVRFLYKGEVTKEFIKLHKLKIKQRDFNIKRMQIFNALIEKKWQF